MTRSALFSAIIFAVVAEAQLNPPPHRERPVGLVLTSTGAQLRRADSALPITAKAGDIVFAEDAMLTGPGASASVLYCAESVSEFLNANTEIIFGVQQLRVRSGQIASKKPAAFCLLPEVGHSPAASEPFYPAVQTRELKTAPPASDLNARIQALPENERKGLLDDLGPIDRALAGNPWDPALLVSRAAVLQKYNLNGDAASDLRKLADVLPDAVWTRQLVHETPQTSPRPGTQPAAPAPDLASGNTYALLVGISKYQKLLEKQFLHYADQDASIFYEHLRGGKGGSVTEGNMKLLLNEKATRAAIRDNIHQFLSNRAKINDTVVLFIAAHGIVSDTPDDRDAYIVTYDTDPQDLRSTALPMAEVSNVMDADLRNVGRVLVFIDVCHAGNIGTVVDKKGNKVNAVVASVLERKGQVFGLLASQPDQYSIEAPNFGGGHGAFTYFLLRGLNGEAENKSTGMIGPNDIFKYVLNKVEEATDSQQSPEKSGFLSSDASLVNLDKPGIQLPPYTPLEHEQLARLRTNRSISAFQAGADVPQRKITRINRKLALLDEALDAKRILPETPQSAFTALQEVQKDLQPQEFAVEQGRLRSALEDEAQQVLLRYLEGDQIPQTKDDFRLGELYLEAAALLPPDSTIVESKKYFFRGRALIFDKKYPEAVSALELAARLDPRGAYSFNGLGIAYLEQADYVRAKLAFRDAIQRAPHWAYPWHNLALAYTETGSYDLAISAYQKGMLLAPQYSYLPYNLGLVYQRLNRRDDAKAAYEKAMALSPGLGEPYNALGVLSASSGHFAKAERLYREALDKNPDLFAARQNLAMLLVAKPDRVGDAINLLRTNLDKSPQYLPSRLSLAEALARQNKTAEAIAEYQAVVQAKPGYVAARRALASMLIREKNYTAALEQLREALKRSPRDADLNEQAGDVARELHQSAEASAFYRAALENTTDSKMRKRVSALLSTDNGSQ